MADTQTHNHIHKQRDRERETCRDTQTHKHTHKQRHTPTSSRLLPKYQARSHLGLQSALQRVWYVCPLLTSCTGSPGNMSGSLGPSGVAELSSFKLLKSNLNRLTNNLVIGSYGMESAPSRAKISATKTLLKYHSKTSTSGLISGRP